jgi:hypothetical protein
MIELEWEYSRNQRSHYVDDGNHYFPREKPDNVMGYLWNIKAVTDKYNCYHMKEEGYDLYHKGKLILREKTVKKLKEYIRKVEEENGQYTIF